MTPRQSIVHQSPLLLSEIMWCLLKGSPLLNLQCNNRKSVRHASWKVSCWDWNGYWPTRCYSLCNRGMRTDSLSLSLSLSLTLLVDITYSHYQCLIVLHLHEQISPAFVRGTYGSFTQIATCIGLIGALSIGIPAKEIDGW